MEKQLLALCLIWFLISAINAFVVCVYAMASKNGNLTDKDIVVCTLLVLGGPVTIVGFMFNIAFHILLAFYRVLTGNNK